MSIVTTKEATVSGTKQVEAILMRAGVNKKGEKQDEIAHYIPSEEEKKVSAMILQHFILASTNMYTPRVEFNDLSLVTRDQYDAMSFNTYQPNNGQGWQGDPQSQWRSRAIRPVVRNKCMSIAAHATARLLFPKIYAYNDNADEQAEAAKVMEDLMEWSGEISNYPYMALQRVITAMSSPASIGYTEYGEVMRSVKVQKEGDMWITQKVRDEAYSCFMDTVVPVTQFYIENVYEPDIQKQGFVIWRKVYSYSAAQAKYNGVYSNFQYIRPGVQTIYDDANRTFYYVYDSNMRAEDVEEIIYWNKNLDLKIVMINGIMMTPCDNPNPRIDKLYPFDKFGYELINDHFFYYKSLAFKLQHDAEIVNTLYQMVIDGTYLAIFKPMVNVGGEIIASDVIVPGAVTTLSSPDADLRAINVGSDLKAGLETLSVVEKSINESSQEPLQQGEQQETGTTAYEISRLENNANTVLGLFIQMIAKHVRDFGKLRLGDIVQYLTLPEVSDITGDPELTYKVFFLKGNDKNKKIQFDANQPTDYTNEEYLNASLDVKAEEKQKGMEIAKVNPIMLRELQYMITISPDVLNPRSSDLERAYNLEDFDRMVMHPEIFDPEETGKSLLLASPSKKSDPDKYLTKQPTPEQQQQMQQMGGQGGLPNAGNSPLNSVAKKSPLQPPHALASLTR